MVQVRSLARPFEAGHMAAQAASRRMRVMRLRGEVALRVVACLRARCLVICAGGRLPHQIEPRW